LNGWQRTIDEDWGTDRFGICIREIARENEADFLAAEQLVAALYAQMHDFPIFRALTLLYFAAASFSETARRLGRRELAEGFLLRGNSQFAKGLRELCYRATKGFAPAERDRFSDDVARFIEPFNVAGLGLKERRHWYPAELPDLFVNAEKVGASEEEIRAMISRMLEHASARPATSPQPA
jgi:FADH2 O2-dependent halogenase